MQRTWKILKRFIFWTFFICLFLITAITVFLHIYEDDIKYFAIDKLNENLKTDVEAMDIDLTIFHSFPYATLQFNRVFIAENFPENNSHDTLLYAGNIFMHFNVMDIWNENYRVERVNIEGGVLNLKTNKEGSHNYGIFKDRPDSLKSNKDFQFSLALMSLSDFEFNYSNFENGQHYSLNINQGLFAGDFTKEEFAVRATSDFHINTFKSGAFALIKNKNANLDLLLDVNLSQKKYQFNDGNLLIEKMPFSINGYVDSSEIDLAITGKEIEVAELANSILLKEDGTSKMESYKGKGILDFNSQIKGLWNTTYPPKLTADFSIKEASLIEPVNNLSLNNINLVGHYTKDKAQNIEKLELENVQFSLLNGTFKGQVGIDNFEKPLISSNIIANINLGAVKKFFRLNQFNIVGGQLNAKIRSTLQLFDPKYRKELFKIITAKGNLTLKDVQYQHTKETILYNSINGNIIVNNKDASTKDLSIKTSKSDFKLNGALKNFIPFIEGSGSLGIIATLESNKFDLNEFLPDNNQNNTGPPVVFELPQKLNLNLDLDIKSLKWDNHSFEQIKSKLLLSGRKASLKNITLQTLGGKVNGQISLENKLRNGNLMEGDFNFSSINIQQLFKEWKNFDQKEITDKNISGSASGDIDLLLVFNPYFSIINDQIYAKTNVIINNGVLKEMKTMKSITDYMRSNKGLKLLLNKHIDHFEEKLQHISFNSIANTIEIKDRKIFIPKMKISSSLMDLTLYGWHDFNNNIDYHFSFRFRELKSKPTYTEFGKIEDDGLGIVIYLSMSGNLDNINFKLDKEERKNEFSKQISKEKKDLKSMIKTEFGLFKNDTTVQKIKKENKTEVEFIYYEDDIESKDTTHKKKNKERTGKFHKFLKKNQEDEKNKEVELIIDE